MPRRDTCVQGPPSLLPLLRPLAGAPLISRPWRTLAVVKAPITGSVLVATQLIGSSTAMVLTFLPSRSLLLPVSGPSGFKLNRSKILPTAM